MPTSEAQQNAPDPISSTTRMPTPALIGTLLCTSASKPVWLVFFRMKDHGEFVESMRRAEEFGRSGHGTLQELESVRRWAFNDMDPAPCVTLSSVAVWLVAARRYETRQAVCTILSDVFKLDIAPTYVGAACVRYMSAITALEEALDVWEKDEKEVTASDKSDKAVPSLGPLPFERGGCSTLDIFPHLSSQKSRVATPSIPAVTVPSAVVNPAPTCQTETKHSLDEGSSAKTATSLLVSVIGGGTKALEQETERLLRRGRMAASQLRSVEVGLQIRADGWEAVPEKSDPHAWDSDEDTFDSPQVAIVEEGVDRSASGSRRNEPAGSDQLARTKGLRSVDVASLVSAVEESVVDLKAVMDRWCSNMDEKSDVQQDDFPSTAT